MKSFPVAIVFKMVLFCFLILGCNSNVSNKENKIITTKIAFGSCSQEYKELPIFNAIVNHNPDFFIFLGDNIYGDTKNMDTLRKKYARLATKDSYKNLKKNVPILATWDDHDYGWNDIGKNYPFKKESKEIFLEFFEEPKASSRWEHEGIYHSYEYVYGDQILQIILLDERTFRDDLKAYNGEFDNDSRYSFYRNDYAPHTDSTKTMLGEEQWKWLEKEFEKPADIRLIGSGSQFSIEWNGYEAWANFPHEQKRMINLIEKTKANGVVFLSGDVHYSEISKLETNFYPIYDFTSSGLSSTWKFATPNINRIEGPVMDNHFGLVTISWNGDDTLINMETWDLNDNQRIQYSVPLKDLQF